MARSRRAYLDDADEGAGPAVLRVERHDGDGHDDPVGVAQQHDGRHERHHLGPLGQRRHAGHGGGRRAVADPLQAGAALGDDLPRAPPPRPPAIANQPSNGNAPAADTGGAADTSAAAIRA